MSQDIQAASDSLVIDGRKRTYTVVAGPAPRAALLVFHGSRQNGVVHRRFTGGSFDALARTHDAAVVYLDGYAGNWNDARRESRFKARRENVDDVAFTRAVVGQLASSHGVDTGRVFAVGYSNGGQMVMRLAHETPQLLAGAAVIAATMPTPEHFLLDGATPAAVPMLLIHGTKDRIVPYEGGELAWWARALFKVGGSNLSMPQTAAYFAAANGLDVAPTTAVVASDGATTVERLEYRAGGRPPVVLYTVIGGGHTIPGPKAAPFIVGRTSTAVDTATLLTQHFLDGAVGEASAESAVSSRPAS
ncbi:polyhydroxybutyrate depolymerase [Solirubrobacter pauli]|uniref:Polyhydroxybutyrate depolymerase n=1 Tax=Solirubrobacter pauli TaxID=166793 RepID=A0A660L2Q2_9ACTN|nr:dienelactone hydrolase family protein [Solirubrobacter pauli]RKQ88217.1 polyhydroxybutyrate depolymerase [Solirubrobacter pauli]